MRPMDAVIVNQVAEQNYVVYSVPLVASADTPYGTVMFLILKNPSTSLPPMSLAIITVPCIFLVTRARISIPITAA